MNQGEKNMNQEEKNMNQEEKKLTVSQQCLFPDTRHDQIIAHIPQTIMVKDVRVIIAMYAAHEFDREWQFIALFAASPHDIASRFRTPIQWVESACIDTQCPREGDLSHILDDNLWISSERLDAELLETAIYHTQHSIYHTQDSETLAGIEDARRNLSTLLRESEILGRMRSRIVSADQKEKRTGWWWSKRLKNL